MTDNQPAPDEFEAGVASLHVPDSTGDAEALLVKLAVVLPVIGVALILLAWFNASGTPYVADQVPMLISGGLLGLGLITAGAGLYVRFSLARTLRFWLARQVAEQQAQTDRIIEALARLERKD